MSGFTSKLFYNERILLFFVFRYAITIFSFKKIYIHVCMSVYMHDMTIQILYCIIVTTTSATNSTTGIAIVGYQTGFFLFDGIALRVQITNRQISVNHEWDNRAGRCRFIDTDKQKRHLEKEFRMRSSIMYIHYTVLTYHLPGARSWRV